MDKFCHLKVKAPKLRKHYSKLHTQNHHHQQRQQKQIRKSHYCKKCINPALRLMIITRLRKKHKLATGNFIIKEGHCTSCNIHGIQCRRGMPIMSTCQQTFGLHLERITDVQSINQHLAEMQKREVLQDLLVSLLHHPCTRGDFSCVFGNYFVSRDAGWKDTDSTSNMCNKEVFAFVDKLSLYLLLHLRTQSVNIVNMLKLWLLSVYLLSVLCEETGSKQKPPFPHRSKLFIKVKVFRKAFEIRDEIKAFLHDTSSANFFKVSLSSGIFH